MKKITAVMLAVIILAAFACPAFAAERANLTVVYDDEFTEEYVYGGEFATGKNEIKFAPDESCYYTFTPEKSGVYAFSGDYLFTLTLYPAGEEVLAEDIISETIVNTGEMNEDGEFEDLCALVYLKCGEEINIATWFYAEEEFTAEADLAYFGTLEDISFDNDKAYMLGEDIYFYEEDNEYSLYDEFVLDFSCSDEEYKIYNLTLTADGCSDELKCELLGSRFSFPIAMESVTDYIASVSIPEGSEPKAIETYDYNVYGAYPETVIVEFTDGSTAEYEVDTDFGQIFIELPGGKELYGGFYYEEDSSLKFYIADSCYDVGVTATPAGPVLNTVVLASNVNDIVKNDVQWAVEDALFISEDPVNDFVNDLAGIPYHIIDEIGLYAEKVWSEGITIPEIKLF